MKNETKMKEEWGSPSIQKSKLLAKFAHPLQSPTLASISSLARALDL